QRRVDLVATIGEQHEQRLGRQFAREVEQPFEAGVITPMQIFYNKHQRLAGQSQAAQEARHCLEEASLLLLRVRCGGGRKVRERCREFWVYFDQLSGRRSEGRSELVGGTAYTERTQQVDQRRIG